MQLVCLTAIADDAPVLDAIPIYRAYPGYPIQLDIPAETLPSDPGGVLSFSSDMLPAGSTLDPSQGVFEWTPDVACWTTST